MNNNCIVKKVFFSKNVIRESSVINAHKCSLDLSLLKKWPVCLQNTSGNPISDRNSSYYIQNLVVQQKEPVSKTCVVSFSNFGN